jgi:ATP-dependent 26S proteasome regulatory subunit
MGDNNVDFSNLVTMRMFNSNGNENIYQTIRGMLIMKLITIIEKFYPKIWKFVKSKIFKYHLVKKILFLENESCLEIQSTSPLYTPFAEYVKENFISDIKVLSSSGTVPVLDTWVDINYKDFKILNEQKDRNYILFVKSQIYTIEKIEEFVRDIYEKNTINEKNNSVVNYFYETKPSVFQISVFESNKTFKNLFGENTVKIEKTIKNFSENKDWYLQKGIPYNLGMLFHGFPGCGKTSTIKAISKYTNRHIISIQLKEETTKNFINELFFTNNLYTTNGVRVIPQNKRIYIFEDIDCLTGVVLDRNIKNDYEKVEQKDKIDLSFILNVLDGVIERKNNIIIMTSNHPEKLDPALIRSGRIDHIVEFKKCSSETIKQMFNHFYDCDKYIFPPSFNETMTPSEVNVILTSNAHNPDVAYKKIINLNKLYGKE